MIGKINKPTVKVEPPPPKKRQSHCIPLGNKKNLTNLFLAVLGKGTISRPGMLKNFWKTHSRWAWIDRESVAHKNEIGYHSRVNFPSWVQEKSPIWDPNLQAVISQRWSGWWLLRGLSAQLLQSPWERLNQDLQQLNDAGTVL